LRSRYLVHPLAELRKYFQDSIDRLTVTIRKRPHREIVPHRKPPKHGMLLRNISEPQANALLGRQPSDIASVQGDGATQQWQFSDDGLHQRGLTGAVSAKDRDAAAPGHGHVDAEQDLAAAITGIEILDVEIFVVRHGGDRPPGPWGLTGCA
jgi:hypothetical protein